MTALLSKQKFAGHHAKNCTPKERCKWRTNLVCGKDGCTYENSCDAGGEENVQCKGECPCEPDQSQGKHTLIV